MCQFRSLGFTCGARNDVSITLDQAFTHVARASAPLCRGVSRALHSTTCVLASSVLNKWHHRALPPLLKAGNIQCCLRTLCDTSHSTSRGKRTFVSVPIAWPPARSARRSVNLFAHFRPIGHTRCPRQRASLSRNQQGSALIHLCPRKLCTRQVASPRLDFLLESRHYTARISELCATHLA